MRSRRAPFLLAAAGTVLLIPAVLWHALSGGRLDVAEAHAALRPLARVALADCGAAPVTIRLGIPATRQWARIRKRWGEPEFVVAAIDPARDTALCLPELPLRLGTGAGGNLRPGAAPYGYPALCEAGSLRFRAGPGEGLTLTVHRTGDLPAGELLVRAEWPGIKDKLGGVALEEELAPLVNWPAAAGALLMLSAAAIALLRR